MLDYNTTISLDLLLDNNKRDISLGVLNNGTKKIRLIDMENSNDDIRLADIDKQRLTSLNWTPSNTLLSKSS